MIFIFVAMRQIACRKIHYECKEEAMIMAKAAGEHEDVAVIKQMLSEMD